MNFIVGHPRTHGDQSICCSLLHALGNKNLTHTDGAVGMARSSNPDSASSQFYICDGPQHGLDGGYAVFGQVVKGMEVVRAIAAVPTDASDKPLKNVVMTRVTIESR